MPEEPDRIAALEKQLADTTAALEKSRQAADAADRRRLIDLALIEHEAVDLETASIMTEVVAGLLPDRDIKKAVQELRRRKPFLFARPSPGSAGAMSPHAAPVPGARLHRLAEQARATGDRRTLIDYLRARREEGGA